MSGSLPPTDTSSAYQDCHGDEQFENFFIKGTGGTEPTLEYSPTSGTRRQAGDFYSITDKSAFDNPTGDTTGLPYGRATDSAQTYASPDSSFPTGSDVLDARARPYPTPTADAPKANGGLITSTARVAPIITTQTSAVVQDMEGVFKTDIPSTSVPTDTHRVGRTVTNTNVEIKMGGHVAETMVGLQSM